MSSDSSRLPINSEADATRSVIEATRLCKSLGLSTLDSQSVSTAVSELSRNILKYAGRGEIVFTASEALGKKGLHIVASDRGPGIEDISAAMSDHYSSSGTLGLGLPGVQRLMDEFNIDSTPGMGTRVTITKWAQAQSMQSMATPPRRSIGVIRPDISRLEYEEDRRGDFAAVLRPCRGERVSGDLALVIEQPNYTLLAIVDALGHGPEASQVAQKAAQILKTGDASDPAALIAVLHKGLRGSLGAAAGLAVVNESSGELVFCGVGNTVARLFSAQERRLVSTPGILGEQIRTPSSQQCSLAKGDVFVVYSDGIRERFELRDYPQLRYQAPQHVATTLLERFGKDHDDASAIVYRWAG